MLNVTVLTLNEFRFCDACRGAGAHAALVPDGEGFTYVEVKCRPCKGKGYYIHSHAVIEVVEATALILEPPCA